MTEGLSKSRLSTTQKFCCHDVFNFFNTYALNSVLLKWIIKYRVYKINCLYHVAWWFRSPFKWGYHFYQEAHCSLFFIFFIIMLISFYFLFSNFLFYWLIFLYFTLLFLGKSTNCLFFYFIYLFIFFTDFTDLLFLNFFSFFVQQHNN